MVISLKLKPNSKEEKVIKIKANDFVVWVKAKPEKNKANLALIKVLAKYFGVIQKNVMIERGFGSRKKIVRIKISC